MKIPLFILSIGFSIVTRGQVPLYVNPFIGTDGVGTRRQRLRVLFRLWLLGPILETLTASIAQGMCRARAQPKVVPMGDFILEQADLPK